MLIRLGFTQKSSPNSHCALFQSPSKVQKQREIRQAGGDVFMIEVGGMAREEAKIAEGAVIDAIGEYFYCQYPLSAAYFAGVRNLVNDKRGLSYAEGKNFADDRRAFAQLGTHILSLLHAEFLDGKARVLKPHE